MCPLLWAFLAAASGGEAGQALLVGIADYGNRPGLTAEQQWKDLSGPPHDVEAMEAVLAARGFDVLKLLDDHATGSGILTAFQTHLVEKTERGEVAVFYYSGHGQRLGDEEGGDEFDGMDESLVPYDHLGTQNGEKNVIDDQIAMLVELLNEKTDDVVFIFDSCFSGAATRGPGNLAVGVRGERGTFHQPASTARPEAPLDGRLVDRGRGYVFLSASDSHEEAKELPDASGAWSGVFTSALVASMAHMPPGATYRTLHEAVRFRTAARSPEQWPQIEGDVDKKLFSTEWGQSSRHYAVNVVEDRIRVDAGSMHGVGTDTVFGLYGPGTGPLDPAAPDARARVVELHPAWSFVDADASRWDRGGRAIELVASRSLAGLAVNLDTRADLKGALAAIPGVEVVGPETATVTLTREGDDVVLRLAGAGLLPIPMGPKKPMVERLPAGEPNLTHYITQALELEVQRRRLASLRNDVPYSRIPVRLEVNIVEVDIETCKEQQLVGGRTERCNGEQTIGTVPRDRTVALGTDTRIRFTVHNDDPEREAHMAIFESSPDGSVSLLWPSKHAGLENVVNANTSAVVPQVYGLGEPAGPQTWKLIAADRDIPFAAMERLARGAATRGRGSAGGDTVLGQMILEAVAPTRSTPLVVPVDMYWGTDELRLEVTDAP